MSELTMDWLKANGKAVGAKAKGCDLHAVRVMGCYEMFYRCPEPMAELLLDNAVKAYREKHETAAAVAE